MCSSDLSVHRAAWPTGDEIPARDADPLVFATAAEVLTAIRKEKSEQKMSLASPVERVAVGDTAARLAALDAARGDVCDAGKVVGEWVTAPADELVVEVRLAPREE